VLSPCALMRLANKLIGCLLSGLMGKYQQTQLEDGENKTFSGICSFDCNIKDLIKIFFFFCRRLFNSRIVRDVNPHVQENLGRRTALNGQGCLIFHKGHAQTDTQFSEHPN